ncbi:MAG: ACP S-malonyltransferase [Nostoc sp. DcaGUA01]|uniref:ACP S-malonyltransferase n=1 Tax=Nostoc sp. CCY 9925 TaxID=3103865 RepID=UPI002AD66E4F|nr:ACP S-malonyltransferase [Nostoc sp. DcaGUA01]
MKKLRTADYALVFPGQGSQYVGMGLEIFKEFISAEKIFESAEEVSKLDIRNLCFFGDEENLMETSITQPCLLATNIALYTVFQEHFSKKPKFICGHSAGEYSALVAAGVLSFADAMSLLQVRGALMSKTQEGGMVALKGVTFEQAEKLCKENVQPGGVLVPANLNSPEQIVISGDMDSIEEALVFAFENNVKAVPLPVSGAFHSPLMQEAAQNLSHIISNLQFNDAGIPVISNVTAKPVINGYEWSQLLEQQITAAVLWESSIRYIYENGIEVFVEMGPGKVLSKLIKKIVPSAVTLNVENVTSLQETLLQLEQIFDRQLV